MSATDRMLAPVFARLNMMAARGTVLAVDDAGGGQTMQLGLLAGETADGVERFQSYGVSSVPAAGSEVLVVFLGGNRDHGIVAAVNDRGVRPAGLRNGEVILYNDANVSLLLNADGELVIRAKRAIIEIEEDIAITAGQPVTVDADIECTGTITAKQVIETG